MKNRSVLALAPDTLEQVEERHIDDVLRATLGNRTLAAKLLGINRSTLLRKLARRARQAAPRANAQAGAR